MYASICSTVGGRIVFCCWPLVSGVFVPFFNRSSSALVSASSSSTRFALGNHLVDSLLHRFLHPLDWGHHWPLHRLWMVSSVFSTTGTTSVWTGDDFVLGNHQLLYLCTTIINERFGRSFGFNFSHRYFRNLRFCLGPFTSPKEFIVFPSDYYSSFLIAWGYRFILSLGVKLSYNRGNFRT